MTRLWLLLLAACGSAKPPAGAAERVGPALAAALAAADHAREPWRCSAADLPALEAPAMAGWTVTEHGLVHAGDDLVLGVIADAGGDAPKTLAALGRLRERMDVAKVDAIVALGGMGASEHELEATLGVLAAAHSNTPPMPVIALPGDLETVTAETAAIAALRAHGAIVIDGRLAHSIDAGSASLATVPGAAVPVDAKDGCAWTAAEVARIYAELSAKPGLRVALVAGAPRDDHDGPAGELALVPDPAIDVIVHGPIRPEPSPEAHGGRDGARLRISPGTSDATPRLPETKPPAAGILAIRGEAWTWSPLVAR